jgi:predicted dehydrogenase
MATVAKGRSSVSELVVGIAGCGLIAGGPVREGRVLVGNHAQACREVSGVKLVAAADPDEARREAFGQRWGVTQLYADVPAMLASERLDLLIVATPPEAHETACLAAADAGVRGVLCEKPLTGTGDGARRVVDALREKGVPLVANFSRRWDTTHATLLDRLRAGALGEIRTVHGVYTGTLRGNGTHLIDTIQMLAPLEWGVAWSSALPGHASDGPVDGVLVAGPAHASLQCVRTAEYFVFELHVLGTLGRARLLASGNDVHLDAPRPNPDYPGYRYLQPAEELPKNTLPASFSRALEALAEAVRTGRTPLVDPASYVSTLTLIDALAKPPRTSATS